MIIDTRVLVLTRDGYFLTLHDWADLSEETTKAVAQKLIRELLGLVDGEWVVLRQVGFIEDGVEHPVVLYTLSLPERTFLHECKWTKCVDACPADLRLIHPATMSVNL